jgi:pimeloyl-ACP methyl ester carboxylesterase
VFVPGAGNRLRNFWTGVGGKRFRSPSVQAADLYAEARRHGPVADRFAVVAWLGYDAPNGLDATAMREDLARAGALALTRFVTGLLAIRPDASIALLGHSYGSTVIGLAAWALPRAVTDIAAFGSPGLGVDDAAQLGGSARIWAGLAAGDLMRWLPGVRLFGIGHGRQPADPAFGARIFGTAGVRDHDHYLAPGTDSLTNVSGIALLGAGTRAGS